MSQYSKESKSNQSISINSKKSISIEEDKDFPYYNLIKTKNTLFAFMTDKSKINENCSEPLDEGNKIEIKVNSFFKIMNQIYGGEKEDIEEYCFNFILCRFQEITQCFQDISMTSYETFLNKCKNFFIKINDKSNEAIDNSNPNSVKEMNNNTNPIILMRESMEKICNMNKSSINDYSEFINLQIYLKDSGDNNFKYLNEFLYVLQNNMVYKNKFSNNNDNQSKIINIEDNDKFINSNNPIDSLEDNKNLPTLDELITKNKISSSKYRSSLGSIYDKSEFPKILTRRFIHIQGNLRSTKTISRFKFGDISAKSRKKGPQLSHLKCVKTFNKDSFLNNNSKLSNVVDIMSPFNNNIDNNNDSQNNDLNDENSSNKKGTHLDIIEDIEQLEESTNLLKACNHKKDSNAIDFNRISISKDLITNNEFYLLNLGNKEIKIFTKNSIDILKVANINKNFKENDNISLFDYKNKITFLDLKQRNELLNKKYEDIFIFLKNLQNKKVLINKKKLEDLVKETKNTNKNLDREFYTINDCLNNPQIVKFNENEFNFDDSKNDSNLIERFNDENKKIYLVKVGKLIYK